MALLNRPAHNRDHSTDRHFNEPAQNSPVTNRQWFPDPIKEREVKIELRWRADERTCNALERQAALTGFETGMITCINSLPPPWPR
jgi:hypothetical protein